jgi:hypothetical protein
MALLLRINFEVACQGKFSFHIKMATSYGTAAIRIVAVQRLQSVYFRCLLDVTIAAIAVIWPGA